MLEKIVLKKLILFFTRKGNYELLIALHGKIYNFSEVDEFIIKEKIRYTIIGNGVISSEKLLELSEKENWEQFEESFIPIRNQEELEKFKQVITSEKETEKTLAKNSEISIDESIWEKIKEYISDNEEQEKVFDIVKNSKGLPKEELLCQMDKVYKIVNSQQKLTEIFMAYPILGVTKNTYVLKDRKEKGVI